jgi:hypothetical protein
VVKAPNTCPATRIGVRLGDDRIGRTRQNPDEDTCGHRWEREAYGRGEEAKRKAGAERAAESGAPKIACPPRQSRVVKKPA